MVLSQTTAVAVRPTLARSRNEGGVDSLCCQSVWVSAIGASLHAVWHQDRSHFCRCLDRRLQAVLCVREIANVALSVDVDASLIPAASIGCSPGSYPTKAELVVLV